jgi:hypothetical protein
MARSRLAHPISCLGDIKEKADCWTRWRTFAQVRRDSNIQLLPFPLVTANLLLSTVQSGLARSGWAAILVSVVWSGAVGSGGMTTRMTGRGRRRLRVPRLAGPHHGAVRGEDKTKVSGDPSSASADSSCPSSGSCSHWGLRPLTGRYSLVLELSPIVDP